VTSDTSKSGTNAFDYPTTWDRTTATVGGDPCSGVTTCGAANTFPIPPDATNLGSVPQIPGVFTCYNCTISSTSGYTVNSGTTTSESITVSFTPTSASNIPILLWGMHLASATDWGLGKGAGTGCATGGTQVGSAQAINFLSTGGDVTSSSFQPTTAGVYCFRAEYTPTATANYSPGVDSGNTSTECFTLNKKTTSVATALS